MIYLDLTIMHSWTQNYNKNLKWNRVITMYRVEVYNRLLLSHKKNEIMPSLVTVDGSRDYHTNWVRERQIGYHLHMGSKNMTQINLFTKQK